MTGAIRRQDIGLLVLCAVCFLIWVRPLVYRPLMGDETLIAANAMQPINLAGYETGHPPFHVDLMRVGRLLFGWEFQALRWVGVVSWMVILLLVYGIAEALHPRAGPLAALVWTVHPLAVQGSVIVDIDNTVLSACIALWALTVLTRPWPWRRYDLLLVSVVWFLGCWAKLTTPLILPVVLVGYGWTRGQLARGLRYAAGMTLLGAIFFMAAWLCYRMLYGFPFSILVGHLRSQFVEGFGGARVSWMFELTNRVIRVGLWMNPILWLSLGIVAVQQRRGKIRWMNEHGAMLWWMIGLIGMGYLLVRALHFGYAKYHHPVVPLMIALVIAGARQLGFPTTRRHWILLGGGSLLLALYYGVIVGDVVYFVNTTGRHVLYFARAELPHYLMQACWLALAFIAPIIALGLLFRRQQLCRRTVTAWVASTLLCLLGASLAQDVLQHTTAYSTTYNYGRSIPEMQRVTQWLTAHRARYPSGYWMAPEDVMIYLGLTYTGGYGAWWVPAYWHTRAVVAAGLDDPKTHGLVISQTYHSTYTHQAVFQHPEIQARLQRDYRALQIGEYTIWVRQGEEVPPLP